MKVYVIEEKVTCKYQTEAYEYIGDLRQAELFLEYEIAQAYCPSNCRVVEVQLMRTTELSDYTKQVRMEVCEEIYKKCEPLFRLVNNYDNGDVIERNELIDILDQIQGVKDGRLD